jgi:peroxiredoxin Q/BCP
MLAPGSRAPAFELPDQHGQTVRSSDLLGKRIVLWFYPKADTPG